MENNSTEDETLSPEYSPGNVGYMLTCIAFVWLMIPGVGYFYSGMARSKSALSLIMLSCWSMAIVLVQVGVNSANSTRFFSQNHPTFPTILRIERIGKINAGTLLTINYFFQLIWKNRINPCQYVRWTLAAVHKVYNAWRALLDCVT